MAYFQNDPALDFDDANAFLAALADTVPTLDKTTDWNRDFDLDQLYTPAFDAKFNPSSPEVISSNGSIDEMFASSNDSDFSNSLAPLYNRNDVFMPSAEEAETSYPNSLGSTMSPYLDFSPNSGHSSLHSPAYQQTVGYNEGNEMQNLGFMDEINIQEMPAQESSLAPMYANEQFPENSQVPPQSQFPKIEPKETLDNSPQRKPRAKASKVSKPERKTKTSHNVIEKKYRTSINSKILELREVVPTLKFAAGKTPVSMADLDGLSPACKLNKASILTKANEYIHHMKKKNRHLQKEISALQELIASAEPSTQVPESGSLAYNAYEPNASETLYQRRVPNTDPTFNNYATYSEMDPRAAPAPNVQNGMANSNMFMGGLATLMGASYINDNNFQAMSAMPVFPAALFGKSASAQLVTTLRLVTMGFGVFLMGFAMFGGFFKTKKDKRRLPEPVAWILSTVGIRPRDPFEDNERQEICAYLLGKKPATAGTLARAYLRLRTKESSFETTLLQFLVGTILVKKGCSFSTLVSLDLKWKKSALLAAYSGDNEDLRSISSLFSSVDGLSMFDSDTFAQRLYNVFHNRPICKDIANGENASLFVDSALRNENNIYGLVFEWRVLEIIHELTLIYLDLLVSGNRDEALDDLRSDAWRLRDLVAGSKYLSRQFSYFELLLAPETTPKVLKQDKSYILQTLQNVAQCFEEPELTDDEVISDDESDVSVSDSDVSERADPLQLLKTQKSMVCTLNLMNEEKFIVLLSSLVSYYSRHAENEKSLKLLNHLKLDEKKTSMSLLSFTCSLKLLSSMVKSESEEAENTDSARNDISANMSSRNCLILESLVKAMRGWLNDEKKPAFLGHRLRSDLANLVISKGIALNKL